MNNIYQNITYFLGFICIFIYIESIYNIDTTIGYLKPNKNACIMNKTEPLCNGGLYFRKDMNILMNCYENIDYIKNNLKKNEINDFYHYFHIGNYKLSYNDLLHPMLNKKNKNKISKLTGCLYILKALEIVYIDKEIFSIYD